MAGMDQVSVDDILASAEADSPEKRIENLEKEVNLLKGSIKKLLLDIRESLNTLENPFQNLAEITLTAPSKKPQPEVQIVQVTPPAEKERGDEEEKSEEDSVSDSGEDEQKENFVKEVGKKKKGADKESIGGVQEEPEITKKEVAEKEFLRKYDVATLFTLMKWTRNMLEKYSETSLRAMLAIFENAGYLAPKHREMVERIIDLMTGERNVEDVFLELYRLHKIINPRDTSMDSDLLMMILERKIKT